MSFPRYPKYKSSGVEWLGLVPEHWNVRRLGYYFTERCEKVSDQDFPALSVTKSGIVPQIKTAAKTDDGGNRKRVCTGDFVINSRSDRQGSAGVSERAGSVSLISTVLELQPDVCSGFVHHLLRSQPFQEEFYRFGKGIVADLWSTNFSEMRNITLGMPQLQEQTTIACFVDRETSKIDALVAEQQRLIELLKENKDVAVSRAVAVGRGETTTRLGHLADVLPGYAFPSERFSEAREELRLLRGINVAVASCRWDDTVYWAGAMDSKLERFALHVGDVVLGMDRPWIGAGTRVAQIREEDVPSYLVQRVARMRARSGHSQRYLLLLLGSREFREHLEADLTGVSVPHISEGQIASFPTRVLTLAAQEQLAAEVARVTRAADALILESERAIALLQERRTALISAAVTGKIDVRHLTDAEAA